MIRLSNVTAGYPGKTVLKDLSLSLPGAGIANLSFGFSGLMEDGGIPGSRRNPFGQLTHPFAGLYLLISPYFWTCSI